MSQASFTDNKTMNNDSAFLSSTYALSPNHNHYPPVKAQQTSQSETIQKILSSSIQRAKQKINKIQGQSREKDSTNQRASSKQHISGVNNNAIASAMKILQTKVYELQKSNQDISREKHIILTQLQNVTSEKKMLLNNLNQVNLKLAHHDQVIKHYKLQIKEVNKRLEESLNQVSLYEGKSQELELTVKHLQEDKQQLVATIKRKEEDLSLKNSNSNKQLMKASQFQEKQKLLHDKQKKIQEKQRKLMLIETSIKQKQNKISQEISKHKQTLTENTHLKHQLQRLQKQSLSSSNHHISPQQTQNYQIYLKKINEMQHEIQMLRQTTKTLDYEDKMKQNMNSNNTDVEGLIDELNEIKNKYDELVHLYRRNQDKLRRQEKEVKLVKDKIRQIQDILSQILERVNKLANCPKELKYLSVKANKFLSNNIERVTTLKTPTKSRSNSLNRSLSRSSSIRKNTNQSNLNNSRNSQKMNLSGSKNKKKQKDEPGSKSKRYVAEQTGGSKSKRVIEQPGKSKRVIVSQSVTGQQLLEKQLNQMKKQYKKLVRLLNETQDQDLRSKLNSLAFQIQQKSQTITRNRQSYR